MKEKIKERKMKEERIRRLWKGTIDRLASLGITVELKYNKFMENYALHGSFLGRKDYDAIVYQFIQELNPEEKEDVDKIGYVSDLLLSARSLNLQPPHFIPVPEREEDGNGGTND